MLGLNEQAILKNSRILNQPLSPFQLRLLTISSLLVIVTAISIAITGSRLWSSPASPSIGFLGALALLGLGAVTTIVWNNRFGRPRLARWQAKQLRLRDNEEILDVGVRTGALLVSVAMLNRKVHTSGVIFLCEAEAPCKEWDAVSQFARNAGMGNRVTLHPHVQRHLPFPDDHFDVVVSDHALHMLPDHEAKVRMLCEMARVTKRGGRLLVTDHSDIMHYEQTLRQLEWQEVKRSGPHWMVVPFAHTVEAIKPGIKPAY